MVRRVFWNTDDIDHRRRIVDSSDDDVKDAPAIFSRAFDALNCVKHVHQLSRAQRHWILRTVEADVEIAIDDVGMANDDRNSSSKRSSSKKPAVTFAEPGR